MTLQIERLPTNARALSERAILAQLCIQEFGNSRKDRTASAQVCELNETDPNAVRAYKSVVPKEVFAPVVSLRNKAREYHISQTLPWGQDGTRVLASSRTLAYGEKMHEFQDEFYRLLNNIAPEWDDIRDRSRKAQGKLWDESSFPAWGEALSRFNFSLKYFPVPLTGDLRLTGLTEDAYKQMQDRMESSIRSQTAEAFADVYRRLHKVVSHAANILGDESRIVKDSLIENVRAAAVEASELNLLDDEALASVTAEAFTLARVVPGTVRAEPVLRQTAAQAAAKLAAQLEGFF